jgi:PmbA protein
MADYIDAIEAGFQAEPDITDYRINLGAGRGVGVGIRDNDVGSVYSPMSFSDTIGGSFLIQWRDGRLSRGNLDGNSLMQLPTVLETARAAAYEDPDAAQFLGPQEVHTVPLSSPDVPPLLAERAGLLLEVVGLLQRVAERYEARTLNGGVSASVSESWLRTSRGLDLRNEGTSFGYSASFDGIIGDGFRRRMLIDQAEIVAQVERTGEYLRQLRIPADGAASGERQVILHPNVAYSLFDFFIWGNMGGAGVYHGQSAWRHEDFLERRQVLRSDFEVRVDPWEPLGPASFGWTGEGTPSKPQTYIDHGRLVEPLVDLKYARRLQMAPNTPPGGEHSVHISGPAEVDAEALVRDISDGVLVLSVLGLHTQDRTSGNYSLSAPQTLLIRDGQVAGKVKATLSGNFLEHLHDPELRLALFAGQHSPGFAYTSTVTFE